MRSRVQDYQKGGEKHCKKKPFTRGWPRTALHCQVEPWLNKLLLMLRGWSTNWTNPGLRDANQEEAPSLLHPSHLNQVLSTIPWTIYYYDFSRQIMMNAINLFQTKYDDWNNDAFSPYSVYSGTSYRWVALERKFKRKPLRLIMGGDA